MRLFSINFCPNNVPKISKELISNQPIHIFLAEKLFLSSRVFGLKLGAGSVVDAGGALAVTSA